MIHREPNLGALIVDELRDDFLVEAIRKAGRQGSLLDLGCGTRPYRHVYGQLVEYAVGADVPYSPHALKMLDVFSSAVSLPFRDESFDIVFSTEVMEHVPEPETMLREIYRVLKPGGRLIMTTPFLVPVHEAPYDFYRYTIHGLEYLCKKAALEVVSITPFSGMLGVLISFIVQPQVKLWNFVAKATHLGFLKTAWNPLVLLLVYLPQRLYVGLFRRFGHTRFMQTMLQKTSYTTKGYGLLALKRHDGIQ